MTLWHVLLFYLNCLVGWGCRIHQLLLCRVVTPHPHECPAYDTKQSDGEVPVMLELWGIRTTPLLPLWPGVVAPDKGPIYELDKTNGIFKLNWIIWLNWIALDRNVFDNWTLLTFQLCDSAKLNYLKSIIFRHWKCTYSKLICLL